MVVVQDLMKKIVSRVRIMSETSLKRKAEEESLQTHSSDGRPKTKKMLLTEKMSTYDSEYYFENGLRKVYPYHFTYHSYARGRWIGRKIIEIYQKEFRAINPSRLEKRFTEGQIRVNDNIITPDYVIRNNDIITSKTHRHELPVIGLPIKIVHEDEDMLVVDKPPSIPIHSCGRFHFNSLLQILRRDNHYDKLFPCHRLDRLTSGMVLLAKNPSQARQIIDDISCRLVEKEYVCKVEGEFPEGEITCEQPIFSLYPKIGLQIVHNSGKPSLTIFERLSTDGKTSIVRCKPKTGRTHQIRVHLQYLGYPIVDDYLYNSLDFGPKKGKDADYGVSNLEELIKKVTSSHPVTHYLQDEGLSPVSSESIKTDGKNKEDIEKLSSLINKRVSSEWKEHMNSHPYVSEKLTHDVDCEECLQNNRDPLSSELFIHLHCRRYKTSIWDFETEPPFWAS